MSHENANKGKGRAPQASANVAPGWDSSDPYETPSYDVSASTAPGWDSGDPYDRSSYGAGSRQSARQSSPEPRRERPGQQFSAQARGPQYRPMACPNCSGPFWYSPHEQVKDCPHCGTKTFTSSAMMQNPKKPGADLMNNVRKMKQRMDGTYVNKDGVLESSYREGKGGEAKEKLFRAGANAVKFAKRLTGLSKRRSLEVIHRVPRPDQVVTPRPEDDRMSIE